MEQAKTASFDRNRRITFFHKFPTLFHQQSPNQVHRCSFCPTDRLFAVILQDERNVAVWSYDDDEKDKEQGKRNVSATRHAILRHTRPVRLVAWQPGALLSFKGNAVNVEKSVLVTQTTDRVVRIWAPLIDDQRSMRTIAVLGSKTQGRAKDDYQVVPLPDMHPEVLLRCIYWGQLATALRIVAHALRSRSVSKDEASASSLAGESVWLETALRVHATAAERKAEVDATSVGVDELTNLVGQCERGSNSTSIVSEMHVVLRLLLDLVRLKGQVDDNAIRYIAMHAMLFDDDDKGADMSRRQASIDPYTAQLSVWASYSDTQETLLQHMHHLYGGLHRIDWPIARRLGIPLWLHSQDALRTTLEAIARTQYTADDRRDPMSCSVLYYALGKDKLVQQLWRQAVWHPDRQKMMRFLQNDFSQQRWRAAAQKNAYTLLSQRKFEMAAAFFLLGDCLQDAVNVCVRNLNDVVLAVALCRAWRAEGEGLDVLTRLVSEVILPDALSSQAPKPWLVIWSAQYVNRPDLLAGVLNAKEISEDVTGHEKTQSHHDPERVQELFFDEEAALLLSLYTRHRCVQQTAAQDRLLLLRTLCKLQNDGVTGLAMGLARSWSFKYSEKKVSGRHEKADNPILSRQSTETGPMTQSTLPFSTSPVITMPSPSLPRPVQSEVAFDLNAWDI